MSRWTRSGYGKPVSSRGGTCRRTVSPECPGEYSEPSHQPSSSISSRSGSLIYIYGARVSVPDSEVLPFLSAYVADNVLPASVYLTVEPSL